MTKSKTTAGIRLVPIAAKTAPFFEHWLAKGQKYVFTDRSGNQLSDHNFRYTYWGKSMETLNFKHDPHDTRHTCISLLTAKEVDERIIQKIVGNAGKNVTQSVYTHLEIGTLLDAIDKI